MPYFEYLKIDLNTGHPRTDEVSLLNQAGKHGWELISISLNGIAYLRRPLIIDTKPAKSR